MKRQCSIRKVRLRELEELVRDLCECRDVYSLRNTLDGVQQPETQRGLNGSGSLQVSSLRASPVALTVKLKLKVIYVATLYQSHA